MRLSVMRVTRAAGKFVSRSRGDDDAHCSRAQLCRRRFTRGNDSAARRRLTGCSFSSPAIGPRGGDDAKLDDTTLLMRFEEDRRLLRPDRILVMVLEAGVDLRQPRVVIGRLITADRFPVE